MDRANTLCHYTTAAALRMSPYSKLRDPLENRDLNFIAGGFDVETVNQKWIRQASR